MLRLLRVLFATSCEMNHEGRKTCENQRQTAEHDKHGRISSDKGLASSVGQARGTVKRWLKDRFERHGELA